MGEATKRKVAELYLKGHFQNDANVETIKSWVEEFGLGKEKPVKEETKKKSK